MFAVGAVGIALLVSQCAEMGDLCKEEPVSPRRCSATTKGRAPPVIGWCSRTRWPSTTIEREMPVAAAFLVQFVVVKARSYTEIIIGSVLRVITGQASAGQGVLEPIGRPVAGAARIEILSGARPTRKAHCHSRSLQRAGSWLCAWRRRGAGSLIAGLLAARCRGGRNMSV